MGLNERPRKITHWRKKERDRQEIDTQEEEWETWEWVKQRVQGIIRRSPEVAKDWRTWITEEYGELLPEGDREGALPYQPAAYTTESLRTFLMRHESDAGEARPRKKSRLAVADAQPAPAPRLPHPPPYPPSYGARRGGIRGHQQPRHYRHKGRHLGIEDA